MSLDLEHELMRAAHAFCAWRNHVGRHLGRTDVTCAELLAFIEQTRAETAFPRVSHRLLAHVVGALAEALADAGLFERAGPGVFALTEKAFAELEREPGLLTHEPWVPPTANLAARRDER